MIKNSSRRNFLLTAPAAAAAAGLAIPGSLFAEGQTAPATPIPFQFYTAQTLQNAAQALLANAAPAKGGGKIGNKDLAGSASLPFAFVLTIEENKSAADFEYHEGRDHVLQILEGSTHYEVGGTPQAPRSNGPGEWLAHASEGSTAITLHKGDVLVIPRGTPHKRTTEGSVTLTLLSTTGAMKP
jgi:mannose-6-phosphate isomerase-like protein (cupin superfamily)